MLDATGRAPLTEAELRALLASEDEHDLFIDGLRLRALHDGPAGYVGSVRRRDGQRTRFTLKPKGALAMFELAARRTYRTAHELRALESISHPERLVQQTRRQFDDEPYRFVQTRYGASRRDHAFVFAPDPALRWAMVLAPSAASNIPAPR